jgi:hypothetical protein
MWGSIVDVASWEKYNATPIEDDNLEIGMPITSIVDEGIDSM